MHDANMKIIKGHLEVQVTQEFHTMSWQQSAQKSRWRYVEVDERIGVAKHSISQDVIWRQKFYNTHKEYSSICCFIVSIVRFIEKLTNT